MSIFKEPFKENIKVQLGKRQDAMLKRSTNDIRYINSRNAWIRMSSGVDTWSNKTITNPTREQLMDKGNYDNSLAKKYILQGGVLNEDSSFKIGVSETGDWNKAYSRTSSDGTPYRLGIRPLPGITSMDVKSRGAYGSLREVTVNFVAWDIRQLEDLELLYMRPGYTVLVEWGWSPYLDNKGDIQTTVQFCDIINKKKTKEEIWIEVESKSSVNGNYEAMFGYVKNYSWSARPDGGYDCQTNIISLGEILESLKVNYSPLDALTNITSKGWLIPYIKGEVDVKIKEFIGQSTYDVKDFSEVSSKDIETNYTKNILAGIFFELARIAYAQISKRFNETNDKGEIITLIDTKTNTPIDVFHKTINITGQDEINKSLSLTGISEDEQFYISLETLCYLLNNYALLQDKESKTSLIKLSVEDDKFTGKKDNKTGDGYLLCTAHPLQLSVDPSVCLIRNDLWSNGIKFNVIRSFDTNPDNGAPIVKFRSNIPEAEKFVKRIIDITACSEITQKDKLLDFIKTVIVGDNKQPQVDQNIKEVNRIFQEIKKDFIRYANRNGTNIPDVTSNTAAVSSALVRNRELELALEKKRLIAKPSDDDIKNFGLTINNDRLGKTVDKVAYESIIADNITSFYELLVDLSWGHLDKNKVKEALTNSIADEKIGDSKDILLDEEEKIKEIEKDLQKVTKESKKNLEFLTKLPPYFRNNNYKTELGIIGNIQINLRYLYRLALNNNLEAQDKKEKNDINVYDYIKNLLNEVSACIGNVSTFDVYVEPNASICKLIDIAFTGEDKKSIYNSAFPLEVQGLKTTARSYKLESKIFPEQSTIVAIGAQVGGGALGTDTSTLVDFNKKIIDRIITEKVAPTDDLVEQSDKLLSSLIESLKILYKYIQQLGWSDVTDADFDVEASSSYRNALKDLINLFKSVIASSGNNRAILPTVFSVTMDGIGGLIIGNIFKLPDGVLPKGYKGSEIGSKLGYVITGIGHSIQNNDWTTTVDAQTIILDNPAPGVKSFPENFDYSNITIDFNSEDPNNIISRANEKTSLRPAPIQSGIVKKYGEIGDTSQLTTIKFPYPMYDAYTGRPVYTTTVHKLVKDSLEKVLNEIYTTYRLDKIKTLRLDQFGGLYNVRAIRGKEAEGIPSVHSWGIAIDIDPYFNSLEQKASSKNPPAFIKPEYKQFIDIWYKYGWTSFGREKGYDYMHFQIADAPF